MAVNNPMTVLIIPKTATIKSIISILDCPKYPSHLLARVSASWMEIGDPLLAESEPD
jgi:hypothetical protein